MKYYIVKPFNIFNISTPTEATKKYFDRMYGVYKRRKCHERNLDEERRRVNKKYKWVKGDV